MNPRVAGGHAAMLLAALLPAACMQTVVLDHPLADAGHGDADASTSDANDNDVGDGGPNDHGLHCVSGATPIQITAPPEVPSIIIAFDHSTAMGTRPAGWSGTKFSVARDAIENVVLGTYGPFVQFGYVEFPGLPADGDCMNGGCCAGVPSQLVRAGGKLMEITTMLHQCSPQIQQVGCLTSDLRPITQAISRIESTYTGLPRNTGPLYALLVTGGEPTCSGGSSSDPPCSQAAAAVNNLALSSGPPVLTFVVGVGDVQGAPNLLNTGNRCLDALASAGQEPRDGSPLYYPATTEVLLRSYLSDIVSGTICRIDINDPIDPDQIQLDLNGLILRDPTSQNGWNFDPTSRNKRIIIYGPACDTFVSNLTMSSRSPVIRTCPNPH